MGDATEPLAEQEPVKWRFWRRKRYIITLLAFFGYCNAYTLRVNLSVGIVVMTENHSVIDAAGNEKFEQEFPWDSKERGLILSSFFYGYIMTQFFGGLLASKVGGHNVFGLGIGITALLTLLTPLAARQGFYSLLAVRVLLGIFQGGTFPTIHAVWARWAPPLERSRMASIAFSGTHAGTVIGMACASAISHHIGWEYIFYIYGAVATLWYIIWLIVVRAGPEEDRFCSEKETIYILSKLHAPKKSTKIHHPWKSIFTSKPVYAIILSNVCSNWGFYTLLTQFPTYLRDILKFDLEIIGLVSGIPYLFFGTLLLVGGCLGDWLQVKGYLTTTQVRKYFNCGAFMVQMVATLGAAFVTHPAVSVMCLILSISIGAFSWSSFFVNPLDIAPRHASVILGISNTFGTIPGIISPTLTGYLVQNKEFSEWQIVFCIAIIFYIIGCFFFWIWVSGDKQEWAIKAEEDDSNR